MIYLNYSKKPLKWDFVELSTLYQKKLGCYDKNYVDFYFFRGKNNNTTLGITILIEIKRNLLTFHFI